MKPSLLTVASCIIAVLYFPAAGTLAQKYPEKPVRIIVGFAAGGGTDATARMMAQKLSEDLGQPVLVENRAGASGAIANERVAASPADGYTLLLLSASGLVPSVLRAKLAYDLERDFAPVSLVTVGAFVLVIHPLVPARNVKELIALARSRPGKLSYGSTGIGSSTHLAGELFNLMAKANIAHVPYKGGVEAAIATAAGEIEMSYPSITSIIPLVDAGKLRPLAVTSTKRFSLVASIPTLNESGLPGYDYSGWYGLLAPAGVPKDVIGRLNSTIGKIINTRDMKDALNKQGLEPQSSTPEQLATFIHGEIAKNAKLIKLAGLKDE